MATPQGSNHDSRTSLRRASFGALTGLLLLGFTGPAYSAARMYTGSLVIHAFNTQDGTQGYSAPQYVGIPLTGKCNTEPYHAAETLTFPTIAMYPATQVQVVRIPAYGGQVNAVDTNGDTVPDLPVGCTSISQGDPLTGSGTVNTTGVPGTSRTPYDPRAFTIAKSDLNKVKLAEASRRHLNLYPWEVHSADLHNDTGVFQKDGGDGSFAVTHSGTGALRKAVQTAGKNKFGGVMQLLGSYRAQAGYYGGPAWATAYDRNLMFNYIGQSGQATDEGVVTAGHVESDLSYGNDTISAYPLTSTVYAEVFKWTTGTVKVTALGRFPTILERGGYDSRTAMGAGEVQLVTPMLTHWANRPSASTAAIGIMKLSFVPEPSGWVSLFAGTFTLGVLHEWSRRRLRRRAEKTEASALGVQLSHLNPILDRF